MSERTRSMLAVFLAFPLGLAARAQEPAAAHEHKPLPTPEELAKLPRDGGPDYNRLVFQKSPYLLQHATNPVEWFPWGEEALAKARAENKPVFLSIGYSTCHWCHVMEHESFEDEEVAALLNKSFVCIKVDREERPDVDQVYMSFCQSMTGSGGWPMTIVMTPDKKPFFAGTYFPKHGSNARPGVMELCAWLSDAWEKNHDAVVDQAEKLTASLHVESSAGTSDVPGKAALDRAVQELSSRFDAEHGGFGKAPKFPTSQNLRLLLRHHARSGTAHALEMVEKTLTAMHQGGIYDQLGGGFHRYSTDAEWLVPHFEKMLYDQALIATAYVEAFEVTRKDEYRQTAQDIFAYILRDMTSPQGGFYSAEDADSAGEEGLFYLWTPAELVAKLGEKDGSSVAAASDVTQAGNMRDPFTGKTGGRSILRVVPGAARPESWPSLRQALFAAREKRVHPFKDDKILTDWNGLMIAALAHGARAFDDTQLLDAARRAADFVLAKLRLDNGRLLKRWRTGEADLPGVLDDYAFLVYGLIELYEADFDPRWLSEALRVNAVMLAEFWDEKNGGLFLTASYGEALPVRAKEGYDGALPSGNSVAALNLVRLARITGNVEYEKRANEILKCFARDIARSPSSFCQMLLALDYFVGPSLEIVVVGKKEAGDTKDMLRALSSHFGPNMIVILRPDGEEEPAIARIALWTRDQKSRDGKATAYVCRNFACNAPTTEVAAMLKLLDTREPLPK